MSGRSPPGHHRVSSRSDSPPQTIPLRDIQRPSDGFESAHGTQLPGAEEVGGSSQHNVRGQGAREGARGVRTPSPAPIPMSSNLPGLSTYWEHPYPLSQYDNSGVNSPIDHMALQSALPPDIHSSNPYQTPIPYYEERADTDSLESDRAPLKPLAQPMGGLEPPEGEAAPRDSFQTVSDLGNSPARGPRNSQMLGYDLEPGFGSNRPRSYGDTLSPSGNRRSRSPSTSGALSRAGSIMRAMSQRVVMISGEGDLVEQQTKRDRSRSPNAEDRRRGHVSVPMLVDTSYPSQLFRMPSEKGAGQESIRQEEGPAYTSRPRPLPNPLKGNSLGIFTPENPLRRRLCDILVSPWVEPLILILIILQAVLLAVEAAPDVFVEGNGRPERWAGSAIDWAIFGLFIIFTLELIARIIVSGFIINAADYAPVSSKRRIRERIVEQYRVIFQPQRHKSVRQPRPDQFAPTTFARSFTMKPGHDAQGTLEEQLRLHLARRAFLRHGFNRLDFVAVVSFWISFVLSVSGLESKHHIYVFRMLSCLRIVRLLALTKGNLVSPSLLPSFETLVADYGCRSFSAVSKKQPPFLSESRF